jgi:hypothetical protein
MPCAGRVTGRCARQPRRDRCRACRSPVRGGLPGAEPGTTRGPARRSQLRRSAAVIVCTAAGPEAVAWVRGGPRCSRRRDASPLETAARLGRTPASFAEATKSAAISCLDGPARDHRARGRTIGHLTRVSTLAGPVLGWWLWAPCASDWPTHSTSRYAGPWNAKTKTPDPADRHALRPNTSHCWSSPSRRRSRSRPSKTAAWSWSPQSADRPTRAPSAAAASRPAEVVPVLRPARPGRQVSACAARRATTR